MVLALMRAEFRGRAAINVGLFFVACNTVGCRGAGPCTGGVRLSMWVPIGVGWSLVCGSL